MTADPVFSEPMKELILTMSAWRRLKTKALELEDKNHVLGPILLYYMGEAWNEAKKNMRTARRIS